MIKVWCRSVLLIHTQPLVFVGMCVWAYVLVGVGMCALLCPIEKLNQGHGVWLLAEACPRIFTVTSVWLWEGGSPSDI